MSGCFLLGHLRRCKRSGDWRDVSDVYLAKRPTQVMVETVGAGARKSVCFWDLLCWTVVCHERLRSRALTFLPARGLGIGQIAHCLTSQSVRSWRLMCLLVEEERGRYPYRPNSCSRSHVFDRECCQPEKEKAPALEARAHSHYLNRRNLVRRSSTQ